MKFRTLPIEVTAEKFDSQKDPWLAGVNAWHDEPGTNPRDMSFGYIDTFEGRFHVHQGDWIVTQPNGLKILRKPDVFESTYKPVDSNSATKITQVSYCSLANLGNYENEKIELVAELKEGEDWETTLDNLKHKVHSKLNNEDEYLQNQYKIYEAKKQLQELKQQIETAQDTYNRVAHFMVAQGLKTEMSEFPALPKMLSASSDVLHAETI